MPGKSLPEIVANYEHWRDDVPLVRNDLLKVSLRWMGASVGAGIAGNAAYDAIVRAIAGW